MPDALLASASPPHPRLEPGVIHTKGGIAFVSGGDPGTVAKFPPEPHGPESRCPPCTAGGACAEGCSRVGRSAPAHGPRRWGKGAPGGVGGGRPGSRRRATWESGVVCWPRPLPEGGGERYKSAVVALDVLFRNGFAVRTQVSGGRGSRGPGVPSRSGAGLACGAFVLRGFPASIAAPIGGGRAGGSGCGPAAAREPRLVSGLRPSVLAAPQPPPRAAPSALGGFCPAVRGSLPAARANKGGVWSGGSYGAQRTDLRWGGIGGRRGAHPGPPGSEHMSDAAWTGRGPWFAGANQAWGGGAGARESPDSDTVCPGGAVSGRLRRG